MSAATALIVSGDTEFAATMGDVIRQWGMAVVFPATEDDFRAPGNIEEVFLLDLRQQSEQGLAWLAIIKRWRPEAEVIIVNRPGNIQPSIAGMQAGASGELIAPFDTASLKAVILKAIKRRKRSAGKKSFLTRFSEAMAAATFAQAGEFDTAIELLGQAGKTENKEQ